MILSISFFVLGVIFGQLVLPQGSGPVMDTISSSALVILIIAAGFDIGMNKGIFRKVKEMGLRVLLIPLGITVGTMIGAVIGSLVFGVRLNETMSATIAMGFPSVSTVILKELSGIRLATIAFFSNTLRMLLGYILVPIVAKRINHICSVAPGGVITMDIALPIISRHTDAQTAMIAVISGAILTALPSITVPLVYTIF